MYVYECACVCMCMSECVYVYECARVCVCVCVIERALIMPQGLGDKAIIFLEL